MAELDTSADAPRKPITDWYDFTGDDTLFPPVPQGPCVGGRCEIGPPKPRDGADPTPPPTGGSNDFYGVEAPAVQLYRQGQGARKAGGEVSQITPGPGPSTNRDVLGPPEVRVNTDNPAAQGKDVYQASEIAEAFKYAKDNNLPIFMRMSAEWCGPCRGMKPMWERAQQDLRGKAVFINVDADSVRNLPPDAAALVRPIISGTRSIPAVWTGRAIDDGTGKPKWEGQKLDSPHSVSQQLDQLRQAPAPRQPAPMEVRTPTLPGTRDILPLPPGPIRQVENRLPAADAPQAVQAPEVYEGGDIQAAIKYAKDNNLPVFVRLSAEWCPPCRGMKPMWEKAQKDLKGKAVFIHIDSDAVKNSQYSQEALKLIRPIISGTTGIPAVWKGTVGEDGKLNVEKLQRAWDVTQYLDQLRR